MLAISGSTLDRSSLIKVARGGQRVSLSDEARAQMTLTRQTVEKSLEKGDAVYGLSTAVGVLKRISLAEQAAAYSRSVLRTHKVAQVILLKVILP